MKNNAIRGYFIGFDKPDGSVMIQSRFYADYEAAERFCGSLNNANPHVGYHVYEIRNAIHKLDDSHD